MQSIAAVDAPNLEVFIQQTLAADWAVYTAPADQVDQGRLQRVIQEFPQGFRLYLQDDKPVGYTGWYPITPEKFDQLYDAPETLTNRGQIMPAPALGLKGSCIYAFNYSIIAPLRKTWASRTLLQTLAAEIRATSPRGIAAVTVSEDGIRVAQRFGMKYRGNMTHCGDIEGVYALRL